jgi:hypothetical protein
MAAPAGCWDIDPNELQGLDNPPAPGGAGSCEDLLSLPELAGWECSWDLGGALGDEYSGKNLCHICSCSCATIRGEMCPDLEYFDNDYDDYFDPFEDEANEYVAQFLATELLEAGMLGPMDYDEFLVVFMNLCMDCAPDDFECAAVTELMSILDYAVKDSEVSDEFGDLDISTSEKPSPFVTCKKETVESYTLDGQRLRQRRTQSAPARRAQDRYCDYTDPEMEPCCKLQSYEAQDECLAAGKAGARYCDYTGPDEEPCCAEQSYKAQDDCLAKKKKAELGAGSGSGSGMPLAPDLLMSPGDLSLVAKL